MRKHSNKGENQEFNSTLIIFKAMNRFFFGIEYYSVNMFFSILKLCINFGTLCKNYWIVLWFLAVLLTLSRNNAAYIYITLILIPINNSNTSHISNVDTYWIMVVPYKDRLTRVNKLQSALSLKHQRLCCYK